MRIIAVVKNLLVRAGADFSGMRKEMQKAQKDLRDFKSNVSKTVKLIGAGLATLGIGKVIRDSVRAASELEGALLGLQSILEGQGKSFNRANRFIQSYIKDGLVPLQDAVTAYKNLAARGYDDTQIQQVMERLKDAAAFGRQSSYTLGAAVATATEGLKNENSVLVDNAGVTKNVAKMWQDYAKTIGKNTQQLTQQEKIQAEVNGIMEETRFQVGDAAKYTNTFAGRMAALSKTMYDVRVNLGRAFIPIANTVLPLLQSLANHLAMVTSYASEFIQALFGNSKQAKSTQAQASAVNDLGDAYEEAGKKAKNSVAGFDQVNLVGGSTDGAGGAGAGPVLSDSELTSPFETLSETMSGVSEKAQKMAEKVKAIFTNLKNAIVENKTIIVGALGAVAGAFAGLAVYKTVVGVIGFVKTFTATVKTLSATLAASALVTNPYIGIAVAVGALIGVLTTAYLTNEKFRNTVDGLIQRVKDFLNPALESAKTFFANLGEKLIEVKNNAIDKTKKAIENFTSKIKEHETAIKATAITLGVIFGPALIKTGVEAAIAGGKIAAQFIANIVKTGTEAVIAGAKVTGQFIVSIVKSGVEAVVAGAKITASFIASVIKMGTEAVITAAKITGQLIVATVSYAVEGWKAAAAIGAQTVAWVANKVQLVAATSLLIAQRVATVTATTAQWAFNAALNANPIGLVILAIGALVAAGIALYMHWDDVKKFAGQLWDSIKSAWNNIGTHTEKIWDGVKNHVKGVVNFLIGAINKLIDGLNGLKISVPEVDIPLVGKVGGFSIGLPKIPTIPKLAKGGLAYGPTLAVVGDNRGSGIDPEVIAPLSKLESIIGKDNNKEVVSVLKSILQAIKESGSNDSAAISKTELGRAASRALNDLTRRTGRNPIIT